MKHQKVRRQKYKYFRKINIRRLLFTNKERKKNVSLPPFCIVQNKNLKIHKSMKKTILSLVMIVAVLFAMAQPKIEFDKKTHEFGDIHEEGGKVTARFTFKNVGDSALILKNVKPGCGCTAANYTREAIAPGESGFIDATYDPWGRPGQFNKNIKVTTNEVAQPTPYIIFIKGNVIKRPPTKYELAGYKSGRGEVRVKESTLRFQVKNTGFHIDTFQIKNFYENGRAVNVKMELPEYIEEVGRSFGEDIPAGQEGYIVLKYNASKRNSWGNLKDRAVIVTNDTLEPRKYLYFNVNLYEDFSQLSPKDLEKAPKISFDKTNFHFDTIAANTTATETIKVSNLGKTPLVIRKIESSLPSLTYKISSMTIEPGQSANLELSFKASSRRGKNSATLEVISNSPNNSSQIINVSGTVVQ